ncbi:MAG: ABC transporter permease subunit, partial [Anaerolineae bacterium]|nr:ABC transporter permease subunit [Anaerolineae bacterium]
HLALADFRERVRRFSFLAIVALGVFLGYQVITGFFQLRLGNYRGLLNAAWIGALMSLTLSFFLSLIGFYITRGNVQRDRETGVGQILAATPLSKLAYVLGKFASNVAVLLVVIGVLALAALAMLLIHGEDKTLDLAQLLLPFVVFSVPSAMATAALAVFFECTPILRRSIGNVIYFFLWFFIATPIGGDLLGFGAVEQGMAVALQAQGAAYQGGIVLGAGAGEELQTFLWTGFDWATVAGTRLVYVAAALLLAGLAALPFERFAPEQSHVRTRRGIIKRWLAPLGARLHAIARRAAATPVTPDIPRSAQTLTPVTASGKPARLFVTLVTAELKLLLKGRAFLWYAVAAGLFLTCLLSPLETVRSALLPLVWLWPLLLWSEMGVREAHYRVDQLLFSAPSPLWRQLPATWAAGVLLALLLGGGAFVRFLAEPAWLPGFVAGALFTPSLALLLGIVTGTERPTQILLLIWWYLGPLNGLVALDITGVTAAALAQGVPWHYVAASPLLLGLALLVRRHQLQAGQ